MDSIAILLTCHNRKQQTLQCLQSLFMAALPEEYNLDIYLVDDGSTDGTGEKVTLNFPSINIIQGSGNLYWAGGMRLAWETAIKAKDYDAFILLNDDVELKPEFLELFIKTNQYALNTFGISGVYSAATADKENNKITYGGNIITNRGMRMNSKRLTPAEKPQEIDFANANILWVDSSVVEKIGVLSDRYTHGIADYDYALRANKSGFPVLLTAGIGGYCKNDHGKNWKSSSNLKDRITYLKSPTGLDYKDYLYYMRQHFPLSLPYAFSMMWLKTFFPQLWKHFKS